MEIQSPALVIDLGSHIMKSGYSGQKDLSFIPSVFGRPKLPSTFIKMGKYKPYNEDSFS